jgi:hypothetical protein
MDEHLRIYQLALKIGIVIDSLEAKGYSLDSPFDMTLKDLRGMAKRIQNLEEENLELRVKLTEAGINV